MLRETSMWHIMLLFLFKIRKPRMPYMGVRMGRAQAGRKEKKERRGDINKFMNFPWYHFPKGNEHTLFL